MKNESIFRNIIGKTFIRKSRKLENTFESVKLFKREILNKICENSKNAKCCDTNYNTKIGITDKKFKQKKMFKLQVNVEILEKNKNNSS